MIASTEATAHVELIEELAACANDPLRYVRLAFPWGEGELSEHPGPDVWQEEILRYIGGELQARRFPIQVLVATGHGPGKSALVAWLVKWGLVTMPFARGVVTANTDVQLRTKTLVEMAKWHRLGIDRQFFVCDATRYHARGEPAWRVDAVPWSEKNTEAFAGLHNKGRRVLVFFDEGSAIADQIWEVTEGALTDKDTEILWIVFGNPTRNSGRFFEGFHRFRHRWHTMNVDARTSRLTNQDQIAQWIEDYGEDSDFVRVRVRGLFPRISEEQFISHDVVREARARSALRLWDEPIIVGIDFALGGSAETVMAFRSGLDGAVLPWRTYREGNEAALIGRICEALRDAEASGARIAKVFGDGGGLGKPLCQRLASLGVPIEPINNGEKRNVIHPDVYHAKGDEMWGEVKRWLIDGGSIPDDETLASQLVNREFAYDAKNRIKLEGKDEMKRRGLDSPDRADALALTFAYPVAALSAARSMMAPHRDQAALDWMPPHMRES